MGNNAAGRHRRSPITYLHEDRQYIVLPIGSLELPGEWMALALP